MLTLLALSLLAQTSPAIRRSTPLSDDPGMVVRQAGSVSVNCSNCQTPFTPDGGLLGSVTQGRALDGGTGWGVYIEGGNLSVTSSASISFDGGSIGYMVMPDGGALEVYVVNQSASGGGWVPDGGFIGSVYVITDGGPVTAYQGGAWSVAVSNFPGTQPVSGTVTVANPTMTVYVADAGPVPVFGTVNVGNTVPVTGPLTDAQLRASAVPVSGSGTFTVSGTVAVSNQNGTWYPDGGALGSVSVSNFPATTTVVQPTGTNLHVAVDSAPTTTVTGTVAATQSGTWSTRAQDGAGNALASSTTTPAGTEQALITRNIPSGTQTVSGTVTANAGTGNFTVTQATGTNLHVVVDTAPTTTVTGTVTANIGTAGSLALDSTLTGGTQKAIARGGAKGATTAADVTSTSVDANTQALDVSVKGTAAVSGTVAATQSGTWNITNVSGTVSLPTGAATETTLGTRLADSTFTGRFPASAALADATANPTLTSSSSYLMGYNGTTWDRLRKSATGLLVDIGNTSIAVTQSGAWTVAATQSGTWNVGLSAGTNYVGKTRITDGTLDVTLLNSAPGSDTGQVSVPVRIISSLAGGAGGTSSSYGSAFPASGTAAGFNDGTNMQGARVFDTDTGAGTQYVLGTNLRVSASGGSTEAAAGAGTTNASTLRVVLPTDQTVIPVSDNGGSLTVDGTVAVSSVGGTVTVSGSVTADTELPAAAVLADTTANPTTTSVGALGLMYNGTTWDRIRGATATGLLVNISNATLATTQSGTWNINNISGTVSLPTGAATETTLGTRLADSTFTGRFGAAGAAADATANPTVTSIGSFGYVYNGTTWDRLRGSATLGVSMNLTNVGGSAISLGQKTSANSLPVVLASDQSAVTVAQATAANLRAQTAAESTPNAALPSVAETVAMSDGTNAQVPRVYDVDTSGSTQWAAGAQLVVANFGGARTITGIGDGAGNNGLAVWNLAKVTTSVTSTAVTCATTATAAPASVLTDRTTATFYNNSSVTIYLGGSAVTTANGLPLLPGASFTDDVKGTAYYCRVASGTAELRVLEN